MMKRFTLFLSILFFSMAGSAQVPTAISISQDLLLGYKMNQPQPDLEKALGKMNFEKLVAELDTDSKKQAFWMNVYISYSQKMLSQIESGACDKKCKKEKNIPIAGRAFSLNDILYRILLHSKCPVTGSTKLIVPKWEKNLRTSYPDGRILFGIDADVDIAKEVSYYEPENVDAQLKSVSSIYIRKKVTYNAEINTVYIPKWLKNFKRDFGKKAGIIAGLKLAEVIPQDAEPTLVFIDEIIQK